MCVSEGLALPFVNLARGSLRARSRNRGDNEFPSIAWTLIIRKRSRLQHRRQILRLSVQRGSDAGTAWTSIAAAPSGGVFLGLAGIGSTMELGSTGYQEKQNHYTGSLAQHLTFG